MTFNASPPDRIIGAPEQPEFDAKARLRIGPIFSPTASAGIIVEPTPGLRIGVSAKGPFVVNSPAEISVRLPNSVAFDGAAVDGNKANVRFVFPPVLRAGIEVEPFAKFKVEVAIVREFWSVHDTIEATPENIKITGVTGAPSVVSLPKIVIPRNFRDANSYRIGGEYTLPVFGHDVTLRLGGSVDESAVASEYVSLTALDFAKVYVGTGVGVRVSDKLRVDLLYGHFFTQSLRVDPDKAKVTRVNPLAGEGAALEAVNGGTYSANANLFGLGAEYRF